MEFLTEKDMEKKRCLVRGGKSDYKILLPREERENEFIRAAAEDLQKFVAEATGALLPVVTDEAAQEGGKYLSVGNTMLFRKAGIDVSRLGAGGALVKPVEDTLFLAGATQEGAMYAAYLFLERELGFDLYYTDFYELKRGVSELELPRAEYEEIPDFEYRIQSAGWIRYDHKNIKRMRWTKGSELFIPADGKSAVWHNTFTYLPPETYGEEHPKWYSSPAGNQLCYTAHGDKRERAQMILLVTERIKELFRDERFKNRRFISVSIQDNVECCTCEACAAEKKKYGADSAVIVKFCNEIARGLKAWLKSEEGKPYDRDFRLMFFAYHATNAAPSVYDEAADAYRPVDESVICDDNVAVYFAETGGDYTQNLRDKGTANTFVGDNMRAWRCLTKEIYFWSYSTNFFWYFTPYNSFDAVQDIYRFAHEQSCKYIMTQDQWVQANAQTGWGIFKNWLHAKLGRNVEADVPALTDKFFKGYFGAAAGTMRELFEDWLAWSRVQRNELGYKGNFSIYFNPLRTDWWPWEKLEKWRSLIDRAYRDLAAAERGDPNLYRELKKHVLIESIDYRYLQIELYPERFTERELNELKQQTVKDIHEIGMDKAGAKVGDTTALCLKWGF